MSETQRAAPPDEDQQVNVVLPARIFECATQLGLVASGQMVQIVIRVSEKQPSTPSTKPKAAILAGLGVILITKYVI